MGEARRKRLLREAAFAEGRPWPRSDRCPSCGSKDIHHVMPDQMPPRLREILSECGAVCEHGICFACDAKWEAHPPTLVEDVVCAEPCGNCAFRPGSLEQQDPEKWKELTRSLRPTDDGWFSGQFFCHKGVPIDMTRGPGNFLFPQNPDGTFNMTDQRRCVGFLRMFWALNDKRESRQS